MQDTHTNLSGQESGVMDQESPFPIPHSPFRIRPAFTLTELLIVIAIIAMLAGLIAAAAVNALRASKRGQISLEIKQISASIEEFKNDYGAYPPNGMNPSYPAVNNPVPGSAAALVQADFERMFNKAFQGHREPRTLIRALCGQNGGAPSNQNLEHGMTAAEALYFWLAGFSSDQQFPLSGPGGPSFVKGDVEVLENRNRRYEFDLGRLDPRDDDGVFYEVPDGSGRYVEYQVDLNGDGDVADVGETRRINFWRYAPQGSEQPLVYFDASRYKPAQYDLWAVNPNPPDAPYIFALKQLRSGARSTGGTMRNVVFVNQGKYQILHAGLDDAWGEGFEGMSLQGTVEGRQYWGSDNSPTNADDLLLFPDGPFIGEVADTLTNFTDGAIEDAAEE